MLSEKLETLFQAALEASEQEREESEQLNVGYDREKRTWEVIVKYHGDLLFLEKFGIKIEELIAGYAILTVRENLVEILTEVSEIEYIEKPKKLYFQTYAGAQASCILPVTLRAPYLKGEGVLIGIVDSGIDYYHEDFQKADGGSRIWAIWDQSMQADREAGLEPPEGFGQGVEYDRLQIEQALSANTRLEAQRKVATRDVSGHGTAVSGIATAIAPESPLLIVKLANVMPDGFPRTTGLMRALTYLVKKAMQLNMPIAINLSFGNTYGSHDGSSLLERFIDNVSEIGKTVICVGSGNEGVAGGHIAGTVSEQKAIELIVGNYEHSFSVQLWKNFSDSYRITLISPGGERLSFFTNQIVGTRQQRMAAEQAEQQWQQRMAAEQAEQPWQQRQQRMAAEQAEQPRLQRVKLEQTRVLLYIGDATPYSTNQEIYFEFLPDENYVNRGVWTFEIEPIRIVTGYYSMYLPGQEAIGTETKFLQATPDTTLTIPSTAASVITVGAYDAKRRAYADFSGRGYTFSVVGTGKNRQGIVLSKPDLVAPGVDIVTTAAGGGKITVTGTSFATPFVAGAAALLMQWGITLQNDPYLYGQKVKAYLNRGAQFLPGYYGFPNEQVGYGTLCLANVFENF